MLDTERVVRERYSGAAQQRDAALCCPVDYSAEFLNVIPQEVIDRDYGCGDPSKHVRRGETVLDLGSGGGKICFIAAQVVGPEGSVIGVDLNDEMLDLARRSQPHVANAIGYDNVTFLKGKIQDLSIDRDLVDRRLAEHPVTDEVGLREFESFLAELRQHQPMIAAQTIDVVVSNCVLNLVDAAEKETLFDEIFRALRPGGRAVISDIVADQVVPEELQTDAELWSGCISGALQQSDFLAAFEQSGFVDIRIESLQRQPWQVVGGIAFRSITVIAYRPLLMDEGKDLIDEGHAIDEHPDRPTTFNSSERSVYRGPFQYVVDDEGRMYTRGETCEGPLARAAQRDAIADQFAVYQSGDSNGRDDQSSHGKPGTATSSLPTASSGCCSGGDCG